MQFNGQPSSVVLANLYTYHVFSMVPFHHSINNQDNFQEKMENTNGSMMYKKR
jgi:hypothetical protein